MGHGTWNIEYGTTHYLRLTIYVLALLGKYLKMIYVYYLMDNLIRMDINYIYVKEYFAKQNCELLTNIENFIDKHQSNLHFKCSCNDIKYNINFKWYYRSVHKKCKKCVKNINKKINNEFLNVLNCFKRYDCILLTEKKKYICSTTKNLQYICKCNNFIDNINYHSFLLDNYKLCSECVKSKI